MTQNIKIVKATVFLFIFEAAVFMLALVAMFIGGACNSFELDAVERCTEYIPFLDKINQSYGFFGYVEFFGSLLLLLVVFAFLTYVSVRLFYKRYKNLSWYKRLFMIEAIVFLGLFFFLTMLLTGMYDGGIHCSNCIDRVLGAQLFFFGFIFSAILFLNPISLLLLALPFLIIFIHKKLTKKKQDTSNVEPDLR